MPRQQRQQPTQESYRWRKSFADVEGCQLLVSQRGWANLLEDLKQLHRELSYKVVHEVPQTVERMAEQNFDRGLLSGIERVIDFEEELQAWREQTK